MQYVLLFHCNNDYTHALRYAYSACLITFYIYCYFDETRNVCVKVFKKLNKFTSQITRISCLYVEISLEVKFEVLSAVIWRQLSVGK